MSVIGVAEFTQSAQQAFSATYSGLESFLPLGVGYLILTLPVLFLSRYLQNFCAMNTDGLNIRCRGVSKVFGDQPV